MKAPRGTRDILPPDSCLWNKVEGKIREKYRIYNYQEIKTPIFEETELFVRGVGGTTDIVEKEMYTFQDKGGRSITLRPEGTAPVVRAYIEHKLYGKSQPLKLYYFGPMFRYERPQAWRYRQHYQTGVEVMGGDSPFIDAEVILLGIEILKEFNLQNWVLHLNSIGCSQCRADYKNELIEFLKDKPLCRDCESRLERNPLRVLDCKEGNCQKLLEGVPLVTDHICQECGDHFRKVQEILSVCGLDFRLDPFLVRGLDYYTRTAFEVKTKDLGAQDTIFGGGRYDGLSEEIGGPRAPGMGFGLGMERLLLAMKQEGQERGIKSYLDAYVVAVGDKQLLQGWNTLREVRKAGFSADMDLMGRSLKSQMKGANRSGARYALIIGEEEAEEGFLQVRDMSSGEQDKVQKEDLVKYLAWGKEEQGK